MCTPKIPKTTPSVPVAAPPPETMSAGSSQAEPRALDDMDTAERARRRGRNGLKIDLAAPSGGSSGLNVPL